MFVLQPLNPNSSSLKEAQFLFPVFTEKAINFIPLQVLAQEQKGLWDWAMFIMYLIPKPAGFVWVSLKAFPTTKALGASSLEDHSKHCTLDYEESQQG